jgi:hypothetical protein
VHSSTHRPARNLHLANHLRRSPARASSTKIVLRNFRKIRATKKQSKIVETPYFSASFVAQLLSPVQYRVFRPLPTTQVIIPAETPCL